MRIAFYLNLQGMGHCRRFEAIAPHFPDHCELAVVGMDGLPPLKPLSRPVKRVSVPGFAAPSAVPFVQQQTAHSYHSLLVNHGDNAAFASEMVSFLSQWRPDLLVVDVGLEASILARLCGIATVYGRQHGNRWDKGHLLAYDWACALWAPFAPAMEQPNCPADIQQKTFYSGGFSRFSGRDQPGHRPTGYSAKAPNILVMTGFGGTGITPEKIVTAAAAMPHWRWHVLGAGCQENGQADRQADRQENGQGKSGGAAKNLSFYGVVEDVWPYLSQADLVIANAGHNSVMEVAAADVAAAFIPAERPFEEQQCKAQLLESLGLGTVCWQWPAPDEWPKIWQRSQTQDLSRWQLLQDKQAPERAAHYLSGLAEQCMRQPQKVISS